MPRIHPPRLFPPHIAERGLLYFEQGKVRDVQKNFLRALSGGGMRFGKLFGIAEELDSDLHI